MQKPIHRILIANRGEIACRILRTCRDMGIESVAVFSDADADGPWVREADVAFRLGPAPAAESYLRVDRLLEAARVTGADAIHPGFGFLAENAEFADAVRDAGLVFIGPTPDAIRAMGSKKAAKMKVAEFGVPTIPGYHGDDQDTAALVERARDIGFPLLVKASAGGGGKGMRIVRDAADLEAAIDGAKREGKASFGDDTLILERYVERPRHVEIQILGDTHGNIVHLFERECSIQRRHQKIVEESPSAALTPALRERMGQAAIAAGRSVGYTNAGTVEFILDAQGHFFFLEVNTRLQVEHPVTESITGLDLVREQIRVARGEALGYTQDDLSMRGAAIEVRLYAEDPETGFLPSSGTLVDWHVPALPGIRVDSGIESGQAISPWYDPMIAKIIAHGADRREAAARLVQALRRLSARGIRTNREFLVRVLTDERYLRGEIHTHFIADHYGDAPAPDATTRMEAAERAARWATVAAWADRRGEATALPDVRPGFRNAFWRPQTVSYAFGERTLEVGWFTHRDGSVELRAGERSFSYTNIARDGRDLRAEVDGVVRRARVFAVGPTWYVQELDSEIELRELPRFPDADAEQAGAGARSPMPGRIVRVLVAEGDTVDKGAALVVLEAMKMEHTVRAAAPGVVRAVRVREGQQVDGDVMLVEVEAT